MENIITYLLSIGLKLVWSHGTTEKRDDYGHQVVAGQCFDDVRFLNNSTVPNAVNFSRNLQEQHFSSRKP